MCSLFLQPHHLSARSLQCLPLRRNGLLLPLQLRLQRKHLAPRHVLRCLCCLRLLARRRQLLLQQLQLLLLLRQRRVASLLGGRHSRSQLLLELLQLSCMLLPQLVDLLGRRVRPAAAAVAAPAAPCSRHGSSRCLGRGRVALPRGVQVCQPLLQLLGDLLRLCLAGRLCSQPVLQLLHLPGHLLQLLCCLGRLLDDHLGVHPGILHNHSRRTDRPAARRTQVCEAPLQLGGRGRVRRTRHLLAHQLLLGRGEALLQGGDLPAGNNQQDGVCCEPARKHECVFPTLVC